AKNTAPRTDNVQSDHVPAPFGRISRVSLYTALLSAGRGIRKKRMQERQTVCRLPFTGTAGFHLLILYHKHEYFSTFCEIFFLSHCHSGDFVI
ncbi:MAG: hypothetical protein J6C52_09895, partial [Clostridia bacterium]|nr:hypothetical protein [Clostridia bacterium]